MQIETILVVTTPHPEDPSHPFVLTKRIEKQLLALPKATLTLEETTLSLADKLLQEILGVRALVGSRGWVQLISAPVADSVDRFLDGERVVGIPYGCVIPTRLAVQRPYEWRPLVDVLFDPRDKLFGDHQDILMNVCKTL